MLKERKGIKAYKIYADYFDGCTPEINPTLFSGASTQLLNEYIKQAQHIEHQKNLISDHEKSARQLQERIRKLEEEIAKPDCIDQGMQTEPSIDSPLIILTHKPECENEDAQIEDNTPTSGSFQTQNKSRKYSGGRAEGDLSETTKGKRRRTINSKGFLCNICGKVMANR